MSNRGNTKKLRREINFDENNKAVEEMILKKIVEVKEELAKLKKKISGENFFNFSDEERRMARKEFKDIYTKYDDLNRNEDEITVSKIRTSECIYVCMEVQALISRITNKIQREEARLIKLKSDEIRKDSEKIKSDSEEIKKENTKLKDSIITVSSLVFMSFTFIQLNFVAFQRSSEYGVLDRIILFSGINTFAIVGIYSIILMITSLLSIKVDEDEYMAKNKYIQKRLLVVFAFFIIMYLSAIIAKGIFGENSEVVTLRKSLIEKKEEIKEMNRLITVLNLEVQNINELKIKSEQHAEDLKKELVKSEKTLEELNKYNSEEYLVKLTQSIEDKVLANIESKQLEKDEEIKLVKKQEELEKKVEDEKSS